MNDKPNDDLIREVYAKFGLAYYLSECLHRELCMILALSGFPSRNLITRPRVEERLAQAFSLTLGDVAVKLQGVLPAELGRGLRMALGQRNVLAHQFWFERAHLMFSVSDVRRLLVELARRQLLGMLPANLHPEGRERPPQLRPVPAQLGHLRRILLTRGRAHRDAGLRHREELVDKRPHRTPDPTPTVKGFPRRTNRPRDPAGLYGAGMHIPSLSPSTCSNSQDACLSPVYWFALMAVIRTLYLSSTLASGTLTTTEPILASPYGPVY